ncbi:hypothetical protein BpHYR1_014266 [Brachionus plicatilis]|uniref:Uncharacterized protein n=1 Tax=Brachionus plicatilis TaxID=10195 RepID=A0A3M7SVH8_BRAPC|nr:hypothetical protein BpHYR1_014266 [Brachionus plicatilis]
MSFSQNKISNLVVSFLLLTYQVQWIDHDNLNSGKQREDFGGNRCTSTFSFLVIIVVNKRVVVLFYNAQVHVHPTILAEQMIHFHKIAQWLVNGVTASLNNQLIFRFTRTKQTPNISSLIYNPSCHLSKRLGGYITNDFYLKPYFDYNNHKLNKKLSKKFHDISESFIIIIKFNLLSSLMT